VIRKSSGSAESLSRAPNSQDLLHFIHFSGRLNDVIIGCMSFIVKATGPHGSTRWMTDPKLRGVRTLGPREQAEIFETEADALVAINDLAQAFADVRVDFQSRPTELPCQSRPSSRDTFWANSNWQSSFWARAGFLGNAPSRLRLGRRS